jgi:phospholipid/cholesterol/gamma-HCH transport system substrate-binding protein
VSRLGVRLLGVAVVACLALAGCTSIGQKGGVDVTATFGDVGDLAVGAPVMMSDITVGSVRSIDLNTRDRAVVHLSVEPSAEVPKDVVARVRRTSLLGERIIDLDVPPNTAADAPVLQDGDRITHTEVRPDLEDLVRQGTDVLAPIAASEVATLVNEGAKGFGGQGQNLKELLSNFQTIVHGYAGRTTQIESVIDSLNQFNATLAAHASAQAESIANSAQALGVLRDESDRLVADVKSLARLAVGARYILDRHSDEMARFFAQMRVILGVLRSQEKAIAGALRWAPNHNRNTQLVEYQQFNQILQDFVICGMNDDPKDPARKCYASGSSAAKAGKP